MDNHFKTRVGVLVAVLAGCVVVVIGMSVNLVAVTDSEEIHACAHKESGLLRVVAGPDECNPSEEALSWNREGPPEPPGTTSLQIVHETTDVPTSEANRNFILASALCPSSMSATGGGFRVNSDGVYVKASQPIPGPGVGNVTPIGWHAVFAYLPDVPNPPPPSTEVTVWAVCTATP